MLFYRKPIHILTLFAFIAILGLQSCAYYNTFYNAEQYFAEGQKLTQENQSDNVSTQEINLYSKSIEKSKKLLQGYPESKYRDDAQFLIARSYYFKGDYSLAKKYFEDLSLNYGSSPYTEEVPLWIGRCLLKVGDLEMARHEAARIIRSDSKRALQSDALLLMGEIAVEQDSLALAETYLVQVIDRSPDGFTQAQAQFQVGKMRENQSDFEGALQAYKAVSRFKPSESLKVEAIIRQTNMLKALNRDEDAIAMIKDMLGSDKFVDIRGQLEVELGKLYLVMGEIEQAESKLKSIIEEYSRQEVAAEADFVLGELYLIHKLDYKAAKAAFSEIKTQAIRSPFVKQGVERNKQIERYEKIQLDFTNFNRQLAGFPPLEKAKTTAKGRGSRTSKSRGRSRSTKPGNPNASKSKPNKFDQVKSMVTVAVTSEDSVRFYSGIDENRYSLAEYMLFEFSRVDSALDILKSLEASSLDSSIKQQSAYMQFYALQSVSGDQEAAQEIMARIEKQYPEFYTRVINEPEEVTDEGLNNQDEIRFGEILVLFDSGNYTGASSQYAEMMEDSTVSTAIQHKARFNYGWLNDHFLYNKESAIESYTYMTEKIPKHPLTTTARARLKILKSNAVTVPPRRDDEVQEENQATPDKSDEPDVDKPKDPKEGEKDK